MSPLYIGDVFNQNDAEIKIAINKQMKVIFTRKEKHTNTTLREEMKYGGWLNLSGQASRPSEPLKPTNQRRAAERSTNHGKV